MITRAGFISNSSSSSFVLFGFKFKNKELEEVLGLSEEDEYWEVLDEKQGQGWEVLSDDGTTYIGKIFADDDDYLPCGEATLGELAVVAREVQDRYGIQREPKLYYGTRSS